MRRQNAGRELMSRKHMLVAVVTETGLSPCPGMQQRSSKQIQLIGKRRNKRKICSRQVQTTVRQENENIFFNNKCENESRKGGDSKRQEIIVSVEN
jgi:hypothetical protein